MATRFSAKKDISEICAALQNHYLINYGYINELQLLKASNVDQLNNFVDLCIVDASSCQKDADFINERKKFLENQMSYTPVPYNEIFTTENFSILLSGIAGIGKTWLLRKCLLDWSNNLVYKSVDLVLYLECRKLNQYQNISNINELLNVFYKDIINDFDVIDHNHTLFVVDGLDEFKYLNELVNPSSCSNYPIVNALAEIQKYKHVLAGRAYAIDQYQSISTEHSDKLIVQMMGFNKNGINSFIENNVMKEKQEVVKATLIESSVTKSMASVPFCLSCMCEIIADLEQSGFSFLTMTDLYANIFIYFLQKHFKDNGIIYQMMENDNNKKYILNICKIAYELIIENKFIFSKEEILLCINDFNDIEENFFGFIERIETHLGCHYHFVHPTIMEFCAAVFAYNSFSGEKIVANEKLRSCLSLICGLTNKSQNSLSKYLVSLNNKNKEKVSTIHTCNLLSSSDEEKLFVECFYESQSSFTDEIKSSVGGRYWRIAINDGKTAYETCCDSYFVNSLISERKWLTSGFGSGLVINKNILSDEEKNLLVKCSTIVRIVYFYNPIKLEGWKPKNEIRQLRIYISKYLISKKDFEENFLPWINLCAVLQLYLHDEIDFIKDIFEWILCSNIKQFWVNYRGKDFVKLDKFKKFITQEKCLIL